MPKLKAAPPWVSGCPAIGNLHMDVLTLIAPAHAESDNVLTLGGIDVAAMVDGRRIGPAHGASGILPTLNSGRGLGRDESAVDEDNEFVLLAGKILVGEII